MYHVESSPNVKLSYLLRPGLLNLFLPKYDIEISSIPKSLGVAALESRTWHPKEFRCYSQEKEKNLNRQIFPLSPNNL